jgi:outer membrane lipoprotein SlyB
MTISLLLVYIRRNAHPGNKPMTQYHLPRVLQLTFVVALVVMLTACASQPKQPVLYPNNHLQQVGEQTAQRDIDACVQLARGSNVNETQDGEVGKRAAGGAAIGGASAAAWGLVRGSDVGNRALAGAAAGATAGAVSGGLQSTETSELFKNFVNKCLSDKGYSVIGWQ